MISCTESRQALKQLKMEELDWLPQSGWEEAKVGGSGAADAGRASEAKRMGTFINQTIELHQFYLDRLQGAAKENLQVRC